MKHIHIIFSIVALCVSSLGIISCENDFDAKIYGKLSTTNFPSTASDYENYMLGCYIPFSVNWT